MLRKSIRYRVAVVTTALFVSLGSMLGVAARPAQAEDLPVGSLSIAPADAVFYSATLRSREVYDKVMESNAWQKLKTMPTVQLGLMLLQFQLSDPQSPVAQAKEMLDQPENAELMSLLADMAGEEMFVYGGGSYLELLDFLQAMNTNNQLGPIAAAMQGNDPGDAAAQQQAQMMKMLLANLDKIAVPDTVMGFKVSKSDEVHSQMDRLELLIKDQIAEHPRFEGSLSRKKIGDVEYLTIILKGEMLPWEEFDPADFDEVDPEDLKTLTDHVRNMTIEVNLGLRDEYVILSIGDNSDHLAKLGEGDTLSSVKEFQVLSKHAKERLTGVGYASDAMMTRAGSQKDLNSLNDLAKSLLKDAKVDEDLKERIKADVAELSTDMASYIPEPGAVAAVSFLTDTGTESFTYNWGTNPLVDGDQPLSLLKHVGGDPLVAVVGRAKYSPDSYATLVKWLKKGHGYFEDFAIPQMDAEERDKYHAIWPEIVPLLKRCDSITGKEFLPSLSDGQSAFVLDAKMKSYNWSKNLPATAIELPLIEPAMVCGVTDAPMLISAMGKYRTLINDALDTLEEISNGEAETDFRLQAPEVRKFEFGDVYYYRLPAEAGIDKRLAPNGGLNDSVAAISISPRTTVRLLESSPLKVEGILSSANDAPAYRACYVDLAGLLDAFTPWIDLGIRVGMSQFGASQPGLFEVQQTEEDEEEAPEAGALGDPADDSPNTRQVISQVHGVIDIFKVFKNYQSLSYVEDGIHVTHGAWQMVDTE